jgi:hypothetical protein
MAAHNLRAPFQCPYPSCELGQQSAVQASEIGGLKDAQLRIEDKLDRMLWAIMGALATSALACFGIIVGLLKK